MARVSKKGGTGELEKFVQTKILLLLMEIPKIVPRLAQEQGYKELQIIASAFGNETYFDETGKTRAVLRFGKRWGRVKKNRGWERRRGHAKNTLSRAARNRSVLRKTKRGYRFDITRSSKRVRNYWRDFRDNKTLGNWLATLKKGWGPRHRNYIRKKMRPLLQNLVKAGIDLNGKVDAILQLDAVMERMPKRLLPKNAPRKRLI